MILSIVAKRTCLLTFAAFASLLTAVPVSGQAPPANNGEIKVIARISKQFIEDVATREEIVAAIPYDATVMGFSSQGVIGGGGKLSSVELRSSQGYSTFVVHTYGTGETYVRGVCGPIVAMGPAWGSFTAQTVVGFDGKKFALLETTPWTEVHLQLDRVEGIHGRTAGRVVGRVLQPLGQHFIPRAEAEATPIADYYLKTFIDELSQKIISRINETNPIEKSVNRLFPDSQNWVAQVSTDSTFIQTAIGPRNSRVPDLPSNPANLKNVRMELWLHSTATEAKDLAKISKLPLAKALADKYFETQLPELAALSKNRSLDAVGPWLVISIGEP